MTFPNDLTAATTASPSNPGFSAEQFRSAMGPGYQVAAFSDQPILTSQTPNAIRPLAPSLLQLAMQALRRRPRLRRDTRNIGAQAQKQVLLSTTLVRG